VCDGRGNGFIRSLVVFAADEELSHVEFEREVDEEVPWLSATRPITAKPTELLGSFFNKIHRKSVTSLKSFASSSGKK
jgi:hypothetical protein